MAVMDEIIKNKDIRSGDLIIERNERGKILRTLRVQDVGPCATDASNRHVSATDQKTHGVHNFCYFGESESEVWR